jgi:PAS domain S-box-containing protein
MNQKLDTEILEKSMAQKSLKQRNELLAGVNEVLLLALRSSSLYELAQAHLKFAQSKTNSPAGFVGLYKGHNQFEFLAMDESVDDTCRLYLNDLKTAHGDMSKAPLLQKAYTTKKIILTNDPGNTLPRPNLPKGHTKIDSLLILPLEIDRNSMVLIALANKFEGFTQKDCDELAELSTSFVTALRQKIMENELKLSEERNRTLVESITEGLIVVNQEAELDYINDNMLALLGLEREQAEGIEIFNFLDVKNQEKLRRKWRSRRIGIAEPYELTWQSAHGSPIHTMVYPRPIIGPKGEFCGSVALITDLTKRKNKESQILQAQKLEAIGQLAAGIAHEINTPTNYVSNNILFLQDIFQDILALLKKCNEVCNQASNNAHPDAQLETMKKVTNEYDLDYMMEEVPNAIAETLDGLEHISQIVRSMKEFAHPSAESLSSINLNDAIQNTVTVAKNEWKYVAELVMDLDPELPRLSCLAGQINQVLLNMIVNAAQAIARKKEKKPDHVGKISIKTRRLKDRLEIIIRDNGEGIAEKLQKRVFEPFFTTKEPGKGTGQGLAISHSIIVEKHKGSISLESTEGEGAQFIITLPLELEDEAL